MPFPDAVLFVEEPPVFFYRAGMFHIVQRLGETTIERAMQPNVFLKAFQRAAKCIQDSAASGADVLPFVAKDEAVA